MPCLTSALTIWKGHYTRHLFNIRGTSCTVEMLKGVPPIHAIGEMLHHHFLLVVAASLLRAKPLNGLRTCRVQCRVYGDLQINLLRRSMAYGYWYIVSVHSNLHYTYNKGSMANYKYIYSVGSTMYYVQVNKQFFGSTEPTNTDTYTSLQIHCNGIRLCIILQRV